MINQFKQDHKGIIRLLDVLLVLGILFNFGACVLTQMFVQKENYQAIKEYNQNHIEQKELVVQEQNVVMAKANNYVFAGWDLYWDMIKSMFLNAIVWALLMAWYIYTRVKMDNMQYLTYLIIAICLLFAMWGYDYFTDLGLYLGMMIYGG